MHGGVQVRGEWVIGESDAESTTRGGYIDVIAHPRVLGRVTLLARLEHLDWDLPADPQFSAYPRRLTVASRVRILPEVHVQAGVLRNFSRTPGPDDLFERVRPTTTFDVAVTFSRRF